ncbi:fatty acid desaturase [Methylomonas albis]|uniref:Fatty acid desaturase n=1 Tax=Methylomonas albis TaxID=1854563 RepID=A0ABR9D0R1_9GAMM|nr:fatty acid desaturase [Methylomonas albis]MBD9356716.1 fatty acid desaturase [Methylomonas albis]
MNDYSVGFSEVKSIKDSRGVSLKDFLRTLDINYLEVWVSIIGAYAVLFAVCYLIVQIERESLLLLSVVVTISGLLIGFVVAYLSLFFHEAAHYNIASNKNLNDLLANIFIGVLVGQDVKSYRPIHMRHHLYLGTVKDTENSYFNALTPVFILKSITGIYVVEVLLGRLKNSKVKEGNEEGGAYFNVITLLGLLFHTSVVLFAYRIECYSLAVSWVFGVFFVFPFLGAVRQIIEHRDNNADNNVDYYTNNHGAITRNFGRGVFSRLFGGAGFNLHLLHHWLPSVSYTCFYELEDFLLNTELAGILYERDSRYSEVFNNLLASNARD